MYSQALPILPLVTVVYHIRPQERSNNSRGFTVFSKFWSSKRAKMSDIGSEEMEEEQGPYLGVCI